MNSQNAFVPFARQWDGYDHYHFIVWANHYYRAIRNGTYFHAFGSRHLGSHSRASRWDMWDTAARLYYAGKRHYVLDLDFESFWQKLDPIELHRYNWLHGSAYSRKIDFKKASYGDYYPRKGAHYRCKVPLRISEKKYLSETEQQKREWKELKGITRDKANRWHYGGGRKTWAKNNSNRCFRRYEKREIQAERYENLFMGKRKDYFDPWDWD